MSTAILVIYAAGTIIATTLGVVVTYAAFTTDSVLHSIIGSLFFGYAAMSGFMTYMAFKMWRMK